MGIVAAGLAGCSAETTRFDSNPFASKKTSTPAETTGSVAEPAPAGRITAQALPPPPNASPPATIASTGVSGGGQGFGSYTPQQAPAPAPVAAPAPPPSRDITGSISHQPAPSVAAAPHAAPAAAVAGNVHVVAQGETLMSISRSYHKPLKQIAEANHISPHTHLKIGERIVIPGRMVAAAAPAPKRAPPPAVAAPKVPPQRALAPAPAPAAPKVAEAGPASANRAGEGGQATGDAGAKSGVPMRTP